MSVARGGRGRALGGALAVVSLLAFGWFFSQLERVEEAVDQGFTQAAQRNPFLAAELFLHRLGVPVESHKRMSVLSHLPPPQGSTLILVTNSRALSQAHLDNLWRWIEAGGHLITQVSAITTGGGESDDPLLAGLGVEVYPADEAAGPIFPAALTAVDQRWQKTTCLKERASFKVETDAAQPIDIALRSGLYLVDGAGTARASAANEDGPQLLQYDVGRGVVTVFSQLGLWRNAHIECFDHAYLLWLLSEGDTVWFLHHVEMPSLFSLMWDQAAPALSLLALLLGLWLWHRSQRFGPLLSEDVTRRRSLLEHLHASAMFAWRHGRADALVAALQQSIRARMQRRQPGFEALDFDDQCAAIAHLTQLSAAAVARAMAPPRLKRSHHLVATVQGLQTIRNRL